MIQARLARAADAAEIERIFIACGKDLLKRGLTHWATPPAIDQTRRWIEREWVYVVTIDDQIVATFSLLDEAPDYVEASPFWEDEPGALYVKRLAVHPAHQHQGVGLRAARQIERIARERHAQRLRFDASVHDERLIELYRVFGAVECGRIGGGEEICFEYPLSAERR